MYSDRVCEIIYGNRVCEGLYSMKGVLKIFEKNSILYKVL